MTVKELLSPASHGMAVHIVLLGEAELAEPVFGGTREDALASKYADREVDAWEIAVYWLAGTKAVNIFISMGEEEARLWHGGKSF